jgi:hypothetical protein
MEGEQTLAQPERLVFLREGTVVLRWLFGYYDKQRLNGWTTPPKWPHTLSTWVPQKPKTRFREATFLGIDVDELKEQDGMPVQFHIGISILRTQDLHNECHCPSSSAAHSKPFIIRSYHWVIEDDHYSNHDNLFCFGKRRGVPLSRLEERLKGVLGKSYPLILVVHGGHREISLLQKLNINLNPIFTIDTTKAARYPLQAFYDYTLKKLLQEFSIPFTGEQLHVAGNDAHFTLRALLMIAVSDVRRELDEVPAWVPVFEAIAQAPLPPMPLKNTQKAAIKRKERRERAAIGQQEVLL